MVQHIDDFIEDKARNDATYAVAYALLRLARAQKDTAISIKNLDLAHIAERVEVGAETIVSAVREASDG